MTRTCLQTTVLKVDVKG